MAGDEAGDVTKALAAFGAPSIRYHSFGQAPIRPSSVVRPARQLAMPPSPAGMTPAVWPRPEPDAAAIARVEAGPPPAGHRVPAAAAAAPARPLAEWVAPLPTVTPGMAAMPGQVPPATGGMPPRPAPALVAAAPSVAHIPANTSLFGRPPVPKRVPVATPRSNQAISQPARSEAERRLPDLSLAEVFTWLAGAPNRGEMPVLPTMFQRS